MKQNRGKNMRAVISVVGQDKPGILAYVASECASRDMNIVDVTQKVLRDIFTMIMIVELKDTADFKKHIHDMEEEGAKRGLVINVMAESVFDAMHTI